MAVGEPLSCSVPPRRVQPTTFLPVPQADLEVSTLSLPGTICARCLSFDTRCLLPQEREVHAVGSKVLCVASFDCSQRKDQEPACIHASLQTVNTGSEALLLMQTLQRLLIRSKRQTLGASPTMFIT